jgi:cation/acetate symporter
MGWTGGYVLVALFLAPFLRKFGQYTIPDFLGARYGGSIPRFIGVAIAILCSFTYVVAQIYGVGLITTRLTGVSFELGVFLGLGGILVCSFLGGMRAVTWTQVAQYIILIIAYMIPVVWLSAKQTGFPIPQLIYGQQLLKVTELEKKINADQGEQQVRQIFKDRSAAATEKLKDPAAAFAADKAAVDGKVAELKAAKADDAAIAAAEAAAGKFPADVAAYTAGLNREKGLAARAAPPRNHADAFPGKDEAAKDKARKNFLALIFWNRCAAAHPDAFLHDPLGA